MELKAVYCPLVAMRSPGRATFHLTSVSGQAPEAASPRPRVHSFSLTFPRDSHTGDQITRLEQLAVDLQARNAHLQSLVGSFRVTEQDPYARERLLSHFEGQLTAHEDSLETRKQLLYELENQALIFRPAEYPAPIPPARRHAQTPRLRSTDPIPKYQKPKRRPLPPPLIHPVKLQSQTLETHRTLVDRALYLERMIQIQKLKLKLCHDHRDLADLRLQFESVEKDIEPEEDVEIAWLRGKIRIYKERIQREKARIALLNDPNRIVIEAATTIQSAWRSFRTRMVNRTG